MAKPLPFDAFRRKRRRGADRPCWGCSVATDDPKIASLSTFYHQCYAETEPDLLYAQLSDHFQKEIVAPVVELNATTDDKLPVPSWSREEMRDHFEHHAINPSVQCGKQIRRLKHLQDFLYDHVIVERPDGRQEICSERLGLIATVTHLLDGRLNAAVKDQNFFKFQNCTL
jgi:hypothetical protein